MIGAWENKVYLPHARVVFGGIVFEAKWKTSVNDKPIVSTDPDNGLSWKRILISAELSDLSEQDVSPCDASPTRCSASEHAQSPE